MNNINNTPGKPGVTTDAWGNVLSAPAPREATITDRGTALHLQVGSAEHYGDERQAAADRNRSGVDDGASIRVTATGETERFGGVTRAQMDVPGATDTGNPLDSAVTPWGSAAQRITPDTYLNFAGQQVQARTAVALGWLRSNAAGDYQVTGKHVGEIAQLRGQR
jgi:hypothetical protein